MRQHRGRVWALLSPWVEGYKLAEARAHALPSFLHLFQGSSSWLIAYQNLSEKMHVYEGEIECVHCTGVGVCMPGLKKMSGVFCHCLICFRQHLSLNLQLGW